MGWMMGTGSLSETKAQRIDPILSILSIHASSPGPAKLLEAGAMGLDLLVGMVLPEAYSLYSDKPEAAAGRLLASRP